MTGCVVPAELKTSALLGEAVLLNKHTASKLLRRDAEDLRPVK